MPTDKQRLDWFTEAEPLLIFDSSSKKKGKEPWFILRKQRGVWKSTPREAIDVVMKALKEKDRVGREIPADTCRLDWLAKVERLLIYDKHTKPKGQKLWCVAGLESEYIWKPTPREAIDAVMENEQHHI